MVILTRAGQVPALLADGKLVLSLPPQGEGVDPTSLVRERLTQARPDISPQAPLERVSRPEELSADERWILSRSPLSWHEEQELLWSRLDLTGVRPFLSRVWRELLKVPPGKTITYGELARRLTPPTSPRAVGLAMARNRFAPFIPCHRVVAANGLGGYGGGSELKERLLGLERRNTAC